MAKNDGSVDVLIQQQAIDNVAVANKELEKTLKLTLEVNKASRGGKAGSSPNDAEKINNANKASTERLKLTNQTIVMQKKLIQSEINLKNATGDTADKIAKNRVEVTEANKKLRERAKLSLGLVGAYEKEAKRLNDLRKRYKDLIITEGKSTKETRRLRLEITKLDARLKRVDANVGQFQRSVGNYGKAMRGAVSAARSLASAMGLLGGAFLIVSVIRNAFKAIRNFEKANATLSAVLQVEKKDMQALIKESQRLGAVTAKTAEEVVGLQVAYARLGFSQQEIINLTEATIEGSIAMNAELSETANLVGAMVNSFDDFTSIDAPEIIDILSLATAKSALNFQKLEKGLPIVAGAANAAGVPFTKLVALMGKLADAGIDVSTSSTAIRNIFIEAAAQGADYNQILDMIKKSQDKLTAANDQFGKRAAVSASVLSNNIDQIKELDEALQNAAGTAKSMADKELDTLDGAIKLLGSAWKGLILDIDDGTGALAGFLRGVIDTTTGIITAMSEISKASTGFFSFFANLQRATQIGGLAGIIGDNLTIEAKLEKLNLILEVSKLTRVQAEKDGLAESQIRFKMAEINKMTRQELEQQIVLFEKLNKLKKEGAGDDDITKITVSSMKKVISDLILVRDTTAETADEYGRLTQGIIAAQKALEDFIAASKRQTSVLPTVKTSGVIPLSGGISAPDDVTTTTQGVDTSGAAPQSGRAKAAGAIDDFLGSDTFNAALTTFDAVTDLGLLLFDGKIALIDAEIEAEQNKYDLLFAMAEGDAEKQRLLRIEEVKELQKLDKKRRKEQKKRAIFEKANAIIQIGINTAIAISNALATSGPPPLGIALAAIVGALGLAQIAVVASQPLPQFAKGGTMQKDGLAVVGDGGRKEVIKNPDGSIQVTPDTSTVVGLQKGAEIFSSIDAFNAESPVDITDKIYSATVMASLSINNDKITSYLETQKVFNDKLLGAMLLNTEAIKRQKLKVNSSNSRIDIADELYKMRY